MQSFGKRPFYNKYKQYKTFVLKFDNIKENPLQKKTKRNKIHRTYCTKKHPMYKDATANVDVYCSDTIDML